MINPMSHSSDANQTYRSWLAMVRRCTVPHHPSYPKYGARGITVCERWRVFENFVEDMGIRPEGRSIDRYPNGKGNYEPGNCRWATPKEQVANREVHLKEFCPQGHPYAGDNLRLESQGRRRCRICLRAKVRRCKRAAAARKRASHG